jgi:hypothetical protein
MDTDDLLAMLLQTQKFGEFLMSEVDPSKEDTRLRRLIGANNGGIKIFSAGSFDRYQYPYRLANAEKVNQSIRDSALELIVDSVINNDAIDNEKTLAEARKFNADYVIPADTLNNQTATHAANVDMVEQASQPRDPTVVPVLQPPYPVQFNEHEGFYRQFSTIALGGIRDKDPEEQISHLESARDLMPGKTRHALGVGTKLKVLHRLREDPSLVDWVDTSTPESAIVNGEVRDAEWDCRDELVSQFSIPRGDESSTVRARYAYAMVVTMNYMLSPYADGDVFERFDQQQTIADVDLKTDGESMNELTGTLTPESTGEQQTFDALG